MRTRVFIFFVLFSQVLSFFFDFLSFQNSDFTPTSFALLLLERDRETDAKARHRRHSFTAAVRFLRREEWFFLELCLSFSVV